MLEQLAIILVILGLSFVVFLALILSIRHFGAKNQYWDYKLGVSRDWDFGQLGDVTLTYQVNPENSNELELRIQLHQANGCTQTSFTHYERNEHNERHVYGLFRDAEISFIEQEVALLIDKSLNAFKDLGIRPRPKLIKA